METILVVEDHRDFRRAVCNFLESNKMNMTIVEASSGEEGVFLAQKKNPRLVIMDFNLGGGINGIEAANKIKDQNPHCDIIMLTMYDPKEVHMADAGKSIKAFISKSDLFEKLIPTINKVLSS